MWPHHPRGDDSTVSALLLFFSWVLTSYVFLVTKFAASGVGNRAIRSRHVKISGRSSLAKCGLEMRVTAMADYAPRSGPSARLSSPLVYLVDWIRHVYRTRSVQTRGRVAANIGETWRSGYAVRGRRWFLFVWVIKPGRIVKSDLIFGDISNWFCSTFVRIFLKYLYSQIYKIYNIHQNIFTYLCCGQWNKFLEMFREILF